MRFGFLITARCNASCTHCSVSSGPQRTEGLARDPLLRLIDEAAAVWRQERAPGEPLQLSISGGEPFLQFPLLLEVVAHGARLGAQMSCVTNGFWAASDERARSRLYALKDAGLSLLAVSTSRFHQAFVKRERVERALAIARDVGLRTALKCALTAGDKDRADGLEQWARARNVDQLEVFPVLPYLRDGAALPEHEYLRDAPLPEGTCPAPMLTVREDGRAYTCCMPGAFTEFHGLGNALETGLARSFDAFYLNGVQQVLRHRGPAHFARAIVAAGEGHRLRPAYEGVCDLCAHVASEPALAAIARREALAFGRARYRRALWQIGRQAWRRLVQRDITKSTME